jgi:hypothetical protein
MHEAEEHAFGTPMMACCQAQHGRFDQEKWGGWQGGSDGEEKIKISGAPGFKISFCP